MQDAASARMGTIESLSNVNFEGATGRVAFDEYGDSTERVVTVYKVEDGTWVPAATDDFEDAED